MTSIGQASAVQQHAATASHPDELARPTPVEDRWDYSHHQAFVGGMSQAHFFAAQQQQQQQQQQPQGKFPELVGQYAMHMAAQRVASYAVGAGEWAIFAAGRGLRDGYRWCCPLSPEELVRRALFTRPQIEAFMAQAIDNNATFVLVQPHRLSQEVRAGLTRDGYRVEDTTHQGTPATKVHFVRKDQAAGMASARKSGWFWQRS